jgi:hypothetical protein
MSQYNLEIVVRPFQPLVLAPAATAGVSPLNCRAGHLQNAGRLDLRLAGGEHPASFGEP